MTTPIPAVMMVSGSVGPLMRAVAYAVLGEVWPGAFRAGAEAAFTAGRPVIAIGAVGAVVRVLAPLIGDKATDPPVVVVSPDGAHVIPVLGGHAGGNDLAESIAEAIQGTAVISTASDAVFAVNLEQPPGGWRLAPACTYKEVVAGLLKGESIAVSDEVTWAQQAALPMATDAPRHLRAQLMPVSPAAAAGHLIYHPQRLVVGVGCERNTPPQELIDSVMQVFADHYLAPEAVAAVVSVDLKMDEPAVHELAAIMDVPARFYTVDELKVVEADVPSPSELVRQEIGVASVAEAAALLAVGAEGHLHVTKVKHQRTTVAVGLCPEPVDGHALGHRRGQLALVGLGPGHAVERTPLATQYLRQADHIVGLSAYFEYVDVLRPDQQCHRYALGQEQLRVRQALALAAEGVNVVLLGSGDAGIYAMGALVFEEISRATDPAWARLDIVSAPGITALQAASARVGAMLGHDFCAISLSDLLTPWGVIRQRIVAAAEGDFVTAFYNPVSAQRRTGLAEAREIFLSARPPETPVVIGRDLGRAGESVRVMTLAELAVDDVDMLSVVLVGSRESRRVSRASGPDWLYTPRGYAVKDTEQ